MLNLGTSAAAAFTDVCEQLVQIDSTAAIVQEPRKQLKLGADQQDEGISMGGELTLYHSRCSSVA